MKHLEAKERCLELKLKRIKQLQHAALRLNIARSSLQGLLCAPLSRSKCLCQTLQMPKTIYITLSSLTVHYPVYAPSHCTTSRQPGRVKQTSWLKMLQHVVIEGAIIPNLFQHKLIAHSHSAVSDQLPNYKYLEGGCGCCRSLSMSAALYSWDLDSPAKFLHGCFISVQNHTTTNSTR